MVHSLFILEFKHWVRIKFMSIFSVLSLQDCSDDSAKGSMWPSQNDWHGKPLRQFSCYITVTLIQPTLCYTIFQFTFFLFSISSLFLDLLYYQRVLISVTADQGGGCDQRQFKEIQFNKLTQELEPGILVHTWSWTDLIAHWVRLFLSCVPKLFSWNNNFHLGFKIETYCLY